MGSHDASARSHGTYSCGGSLQSDYPISNLSDVNEDLVLLREICFE